MDLLRKKHRDREVLLVLARGWDRLSLEELLSTLEEALRDERVKEAREILAQGRSLSEALYEAGLISENFYRQLSAVENTRTVPEFLKEKLSVEESVRRFSGELKGTLFIPAVAFVLSFGVLALGIYRLVPAMVQNVTSLPGSEAKLPFYFEYLLWLSERPLAYVLFVLSVFLGLFLLYAERNRIPLLRKFFAEYEKLFFWGHLYLSLKAGLTEREALERYRGGLEREAKAVLDLMERGVPAAKALLEAMKEVLDAVEKAMLVSAFRGDAVEGFRDLFRDREFVFRTSLTKFKNLFLIVAYLVVGGIVVFLFLGVYLPVLRVLVESM